jgi:hypothetical protein
MSQWRPTSEAIPPTERGETSLTAQIFVGVVVVLIGAVMLSSEQIERRVTDGFLRDYYRKAVRNDQRDQAWASLTEEFRKSRLNDDRKAYDQFFRKWKAVRVSQVHKVPEEQNQFTAVLTYVPKRGRTPPSEKVVFKLDCSDLVAKNPFDECASKDLMIDDTTKPD